MLTILVAYFAVGYLVMDLMFSIHTAKTLRNDSSVIRMIFMVLFLMIKYSLIWPTMMVDSMLHVSIDIEKRSKIVEGEETGTKVIDIPMNSIQWSSVKPAFDGFYNKLKGFSLSKDIFGIGHEHENEISEEALTELKV